MYIWRENISSGPGRGPFTAVILPCYARAPFRNKKGLNKHAKRGYTTMSEEKVVRAALYVRVSTEDQAEKGSSIGAQIDFLEDWAQKEGWAVADRYVDDGYSGKNLDRPALQRLIKDAEAGNFDLVLCYHNDRLSRDTRDALTITQDLLKHEVRFRFSNLDVDLASPEGELLFTMQAGFATYFRKDLGRKTKFGMQKIKKDGYWIGRVPDLFDKEREKHTKILPTDTVKRILELKKAGNTMREIARIISKETGKPINHVKIWRALKVYNSLETTAE
jgi:site-specific DNA recombinase